MQPSDIQKLVTAQRTFHRNNNLDYAFRRQQLRTLKAAIDKYERKILDALQADLGKPEFEGFSSDVAFTMGDLELSIKKLKTWMRPKRVSTPLAYWPGSSKIHPEPYGVTLILGTWNYPFNLVAAPLIGAMAAGNCAVIKPSELAPATAAVTEELFAEYFDPAYITVVNGDGSVAQSLLAEPWDYIFFTGSPAIGKKVMAAAAPHLTPLTLELGGKSPCIIDKQVDMAATARRVLYGKCYNAGQTCVAPDYVLVQASVKDAFIQQCSKTITEFYGKDVAKSPDYARIVNHRHFDRLTGLLQDANILVGGETDRDHKYIAPTLVDGVDWQHPIMNEEIFGPILPVLAYNNLDEAIHLVNSKPKPLALYFFSKDKENQKKVIKQTSSGGICINDTINHIVPHNLPFGGVGNSGFGNYHGKATFDAFTHYKSNLNQSFIFDPKMKYPPYKMTSKDIKIFLKLMTG